MKHLGFTTTHEWAKIDTDGTVLMGLSQHGATEGGELVHLACPAPGTTTKRGLPCIEAESLKTVIDIAAPIDGEVLASNPAVLADPLLVNRDPEGAGWLLRIKPKDKDPLSGLLSSEEYQRMLKQG